MIINQVNTTWPQFSSWWGLRDYLHHAIERNDRKFQTIIWKATVHPKKLKFLRHKWQTRFLGNGRFSEPFLILFCLGEASLVCQSQFP